VATWRVINTDLKTGTVLGELPVQDFSFADVLNSDGNFAVSLPLVTTTPTGRLTNDASAIQITEADLEPGANALYFERDGAILWGGIVWGVKGNVASNALAVSGAGFNSYFRRRYIRLDATHSTVDQLDIARAFIDNAQTVAEGSIGIGTTDSNTSGVTRDITYNAYERKNVADALSQLANVNGGFDYRFHSFRNGSGVITTEFRVSYPATGRTTNFVFELGTNVQLLDFEFSGGALTNTVDAVGAGDGSDMLIRTAQNTASLADKPLLESVLPLADVSAEATLDTHAARAITRGASNIKSLTVAVFGDEIPVLGSYVVGDQVEVRGDYGYISLSSFYRITSVGVTVGLDGTEQVNLSLVPLDVFVS